jgi:hypothetical protein
VNIIFQMDKIIGGKSRGYPFDINNDCVHFIARAGAA